MKLRYKILIALLILGVFLAGLIINLPARVVLWFVPETINVKIAAPTGTIWEGYSSEVILENVQLGELSWQLKPNLFGKLGDGYNSNLTLSNIQLGELHWKVMPKSLLKGQAVVLASLKSPQGFAVAGQFGYEVFTGRQWAQDTQAKIDSGWLAQYTELPFQVNGSFNADIKYLARTADVLLPLGTATASWQPAGITIPPYFDLKGYQADFTTQDGKLVGKIRDLDSPMQADGELVLHPQGNYALQLIITPDNALLGSVTTLLTLFAKQDERGRFLLSLKGNLPTASSANSK